MPILRNAAGGEKSVSDPAQAQALVDSGQWTYADKADAKSIATVDMVTGVPSRTAREDYDLDAAAGLQQQAPEGADAALGRAQNAFIDEKYGTLGQNLAGAAEGAASVLTLSGSDWLLDQAGFDTANREKHTAGRTVGEIAGIAGTILAPGGAAAAAEKLAAGEALGLGSKLARTVMQTPAGVLSEFGAGGKTALARVARVAGEGTAYGLAQASTNLALAEPGVAAESWASELGQGALLGLATGAVAGVGIEGARAFSAARAARRGALDLEKGPGKELVEGLAKASNDVDHVLESAAIQHGDSIKAVGEQLKQARSVSLAQDVDDVAESVVQMRAAAGETLTGPAKAKFTIAENLAAKAVKTGREVDQLAYLQYVEKTARKAGAPELADQVVARMQKAADAAKFADEHLASLAVKFPKAKYDKIFDLLPDDKVGPDAFKRLFKMAEKNPDELTKRLSMLNEFHEAAKGAVKGNDIASSRLAEALGGMDDAVRRLVTPETENLLKDPKVLGSILGIKAGIEALSDGTPGKRLLQFAAAYKLVGGMAGVKAAGKSTFARIANSIGRRASAGLFAGIARDLPVVQRMGSAGATAVMGGSASAGYEFYNWLQRQFSGGARAAISSTAHAANTIEAAVERAATGKPRRIRAMPTTQMVLDKMLGDPEQSKKSPQEKFKLIQERLSKYAVAPDAINEGLYHVLKPIADVSEQLADMMEATIGVQLSYLQSKMPQDPGTMMMFGKSMWQPTDRELYEFAMHGVGALMPLHTVDLIADGLVPPQAAEALAATNPEIFAKLQMGMIERADEIRANSTYNQRIALGLAFQLPLDPTTDPRYVAFQQSMHAQKTMDQAAGDSGEASTPEESYSDAQKLLS